MPIPSIPKGTPYTGSIELGVDRNDGNLEAHLYTENLHLRSIQQADTELYQKLFGDPAVMTLFATGATKTPEQTAQRVEGWVRRWQIGNPYSAFAMFNSDNDAFVGHMITGGGEDTAYDKTPEAGYSEMAFLLVKDQWGKGYGKQGAAAIVKEFVPWMQKQSYLVPTDVEDKVFKRPLVWLTATSRFDNEASNRILTGLEFECKNVGEKFGHKRGYFGLRV